MSPGAQEIAALDRRIRAPLRAWLARSLPHQEAEDIAQEAFVRTLEAFPRLRDPAKAESLLWTIARNLRTDALRRRSPSSLDPDEIAHEPQLPDAATQMVARWLPAFVQTLDEPYRTALQRVDLDGITQAELALELGISPSGARSRVQRGRALLQAQLLACCQVGFEGGEVSEVRRNGTGQGSCGGC
ncbi:MAG: sigma-70 family RNA polymerase sigma factor [Myxococcota bacterium]|nr:sigma-70 family RNA polymerase sigma factor [Myxococcota bacterium]